MVIQPPIKPLTEEEKHATYYDGREFGVNSVKYDDSVDRTRDTVLELDAKEEIVCVFVDPEQPGIMFYDMTNELGAQEDIRRKKEGRYITEKDSIHEVVWDEDVNTTDGKNNVYYGAGGCVKVTTIIVTKEKMKEILDKIEKSKGSDRVVVDTGKIFNLEISENYKDDANSNINDIKYDNEVKQKDFKDTTNDVIGDINYENFRQVRDEVLKIYPTNNIDNFATSYSDENYNKGHGTK